jgi:hypothetical protein
MPDYNQGKIYSIRSLSRPDLVYIGSTSQSLAKRFGSHKSPSNNTRSKCIIEIGDTYIELIEEYPCANKNQLEKREGEIMRSMDCVNKNIAGRTRAEYSTKQYEEDNAVHIAARHKKYNQDNFAHNKAVKKQYKQEKKNIQTCICGTEFNYGCAKTTKVHFASGKHSRYVEERQELALENYRSNI